eukprot:scaffold44_cov411-Prasinococcus_capsulatus_cf.AAC.35
MVLISSPLIRLTIVVYWQAEDTFSGWPQDTGLPPTSRAVSGQALKPSQHCRGQPLVVASAAPFASAS